MFERFTERARQIVVLAQDEARANEQGYIGAEHILLGILREEDGIAARVLADLDVKLDVARKAADAKAMGQRQKIDGQIPFTPRAKKCLELALREALSLGHNYIGTEHVLLGLLREGDNIAVEILRDDFSLEDEAIRNAVIRMLSGKKAPILTKGKESHPFTAVQEVQEHEVREIQSKLDELKKQSAIRDLLVDAANLARQYPDRDPQRIAAAVLAMS